MSAREILQKNKARDKKTSIDVNKELHEKLVAQLDKDGFSFADFVEAAMIDYLTPTKEKQNGKVKTV